MQPSCAVRYLVAIFVDLQFAVTIGGADYERGFTFLVRPPLVAPETPAQLSSGFCNLRIIPRFTVVIADLHFGNSAITTESHPA